MEYSANNPALQRNYVHHATPRLPSEPEPKLPPYYTQGLVFQSQLPTSSSVVKYPYNTGIAEPSNPGKLFNGTQGLPMYGHATTSYINAPIPISPYEVAANLETYDPRTMPMNSKEVADEFDAFYKTPAGQGGKLYKTRNRRGRKSIISKKSRKSRKARKHRRSRKHIA
jgi:hypothetical protein